MKRRRQRTATERAAISTGLRRAAAERAKEPVDINAPWLTSRAAAHRALCSELTVLRAARSGKLRFVRINGSRVYRFRPAWIDTWLESMTPEAAEKRSA